MAIPQPAIKFSFEDYLAWEQAQAEKHEFVQGEIFAMAGARQAHVTVSLNLASAFKTHLRGGSCRTYIADMKVRVEEADAGYYPDVAVSCDRRDVGGDLLFIRHPLLIVEVLSDSTAAFDRGNKFADYRKLESLQEYAVVDIAARRVECFRRNAEHRWVLYDFADEAECEFASIGLSMPLGLVFEDVEETNNAEADGAA